LASQNIEFVQCVSEATGIEVIGLAIALSDLAHGCANIACWVASETKESIQDFVNNITDPIGSAYKVVDIAKNVGCCLGKVMRSVAEAMVQADSEGIGWAEYVQVLEQEHQYDAQLAQQVIDTMQDWIVHSSVQEKVRMGTRCVVDGVLYGNVCKFLSHTGKACCGLIADVPEFRLLEEVTEYGLVTEIGEVGLQSAEDLGISILKSEIDIFRKSKSIKNGIKNSSSKLAKVEKADKKSAIRVARKAFQFDIKTYPHHLNKFSENINDIDHMFRKSYKKLSDTIINRDKVLKMTRDPSKCFGMDANKVVSYAQVEKDGTQLWAEVNPLNHYIRNSGVNESNNHRVWNPKTGFKLESSSENRIKK